MDNEEENPDGSVTLGTSSPNANEQPKSDNQWLSSIYISHALSTWVFIANNLSRYQNNSSMSIKREIDLGSF